jgi:hypothetical protein
MKITLFSSSCVSPSDQCEKCLTHVNLDFIGMSSAKVVPVGQYAVFKCTRKRDGHVHVGMTKDLSTYKWANAGQYDVLGVYGDVGTARLARDKARVAHGLRKARPVQRVFKHAYIGNGFVQTARGYEQFDPRRHEINYDLYRGDHPTVSDHDILCLQGQYVDDPAEPPYYSKRVAKRPRSESDKMAVSNDEKVVGTGVVIPLSLQNNSLLNPLVGDIEDWKIDEEVDESCSRRNNARDNVVREMLRRSEERLRKSRPPATLEELHGCPSDEKDVQHVNVLVPRRTCRPKSDTSK